MNPMQPINQPLMLLTCQHDSHAFDERSVVVNEVIKVGRAVVRTKASPSNAIFDCKVLSRNHAVIWFNSDEFWLRDTNSSNGTFVNNTRITKRDDSDFCDRQIFSGDVIRFGVDVVENETTHGCIIAAVTLYLPNGCEAKSKVGQITGDSVPVGHVPISAEQIFQLSCFVNDTVFREQVLEKKLITLSTALQKNETSLEIGWQAMLNEVKLLEKLNLYESQLRLFKEDCSEQSIKMKLSDTLEDAHFKDMEKNKKLNELINKQSNYLQQISELENSIISIQEESNYLRDSYTSAQNANTTLSIEFKSMISDLTQQLADGKNSEAQLNEKITLLTNENKEYQSRINNLSFEVQTLKENAESFQPIEKQKSCINGTPFGEEVLTNEDSERQLAFSSTDNQETTCNDFDRIVNRGVNSQLADSQISGDACKNELSLSSKEHLNEFIRDFHKSSELVQILKAKVIDNPNSIFTNNENKDSQTYSTKSIPLIVNLIQRYQESSRLSLQEFFLHINSIAYEELSKYFELNYKNVDGDLAAFQNKFVASVGVNTVTRPDFLPFPNLSDKSIETCYESPFSSYKSENVEVVRPDSSNSKVSPFIDAPCIGLKNSPSNEIILTKGVPVNAGLPDDLSKKQNECADLRAKIENVEFKMRQSKKNHARLIEETRNHRSEVDFLRSELARLQNALAESNEGNKLSDHHLSFTRSPDCYSSASDSIIDDSQLDSESVELVPRRLITITSLTVIPLIVVLFAVMFAIFSKFVS